MKHKSYLKRSKSRDTLQLYSPNKREATVYPDFSFQNVINLINSDPVARGAVNHFVDKFMEGDFSFVNSEGKYRPDNQMRFQERYNFRHKVLRNTVLLGKLFNNVYLEIVRNADNVVTDVNVLDSLNVKPVTENNGDPIRYISRVANPETGEYARWEKDDVVWVKFGDRSIGYAPVDLRALWETIHAKHYLLRFIAWLTKTGQYRVHYMFANGVASQNIEDFMTYLRLNDEDYKSPSINKGEVEAKVVRDIKELDSMQNLLKYYDSQILILLRIPPIDAGIPDASGRSNSDAQSNNLTTTITSFKKAIEDAYNFELFKKMKVGNTFIRFGPNDRFQERMIFENLQIMSSIGMTNKVMEEYMYDKGMVWKTKVFEPKPKEGVAANSDNPRDLDNMPSRQGKAEGVGNQKQPEPTSRPDQVGEQ